MSVIHDERGSATIEAVIGIPAFLLLVGMIIFGGRVAIAHSSVEAAAADAARAASIARDPGAASGDARSAAQSGLRNQKIQCASTHVTVDTSGFAVQVGQPAEVTVTVSCRLDLSDLSLPVPGSRLIRATISSPIDTWRERSDSR